MNDSRQRRARPFMVWLALGLLLGTAGCSNYSSQSGTQAPVQEADKEAALKSAELRREHAKQKAMLPRAKRRTAE